MKGINYYTRKINQNKQFRKDCRVSLSPSEIKMLLHLDPREHKVSVSLPEYELIMKGNKNYD